MKKSEKIEWLAQQLWEQTQSKMRFESAWKDEYKKRKALEEENAKLRLENDLARMQLQDAQEKMRKPVFVPVK